MDLFLRDFQTDSFGDKRDAIASPLPPGAAVARQRFYSVFRLFEQARDDRGAIVSRGVV